MSNPTLPKNLSKKISEKRKTLLNSPKYSFPIKERLELYEAFGILSCPATLAEKENRIENLKKGIINLTIADTIVAWLAILSTQKVLPLFTLGVLPLQQRDVNYDVNIENYNQLPFRILELAEKILIEKEGIKKAWLQINNEFHYATDTVYSIYNYNSVCVFNASIDTLLSTLGISLYDDLPKALFLEELGLRQVELVAGDAPSEAMMAYSLVDSEPIHHWDEWEPRKVDFAKRLEFWEWWLTEAIPQAWELAHTTYRSQS
jgi:hypothetical protein